MEYDVMVTSHHPCLNNERLNSKREEYFLLEPCEIFTEKEYIKGGLTRWVDSVDEGDVNLVYVNETQYKEAIMEASRLEEP
jgi:hypothetical protein